MMNPHPKETHDVDSVSSGVTLLAYFAARCPLPFPAQGRSEGLMEQVVLEDCKYRIEWARTMLHVLWPVSAKNSGGAP